MTEIKAYCRWLFAIGGFVLGALFPAGEQPQNIRKTIQKTRQLGIWKSLLRAGEVNQGAFGTAGNGARHVGMGT